MRIGIVCPYSFDAPGGVQFHIRDHAEHLLAIGHEVSVLAPAEEGTAVPDYVVAAGRTIPFRYNGSVARLNFGPLTAARVRRWLADGNFDVLHIHEPVTPSLGMIALWIARGPIVATFHTSNPRSRAMQIAYPMVRPSLEKLAARIAVSEDARRTVVEHVGGDAIIIPNGVWVDRFAAAQRAEKWFGTPTAPTIAFLGRLDEPRKGLPILCDAVPEVLAQHPGARFLIAGRGDASAAQAMLGDHARSVEFLGGISEQEKTELLSSVDLYIAPQTGGESFGIVLVEGMSAGTTVVASNIGAFQRVLDYGELGALFSNGDSSDLARVINDLLAHPEKREAFVERATAAVGRYDWPVVAERILTVYEMVAAQSPESVSADSPHHASGNLAGAAERHGSLTSPGRRAPNGRKDY